MKKGNGFMAGLIFIIGVGSLCAYHNIQKTEYLNQASQQKIVDDNYGEVNTEAVYVYQTYYDNMSTGEFITTKGAPENKDGYSYRFIGASYDDEIVVYEKETKENGKWTKTNSYVLSAGSDSDNVRYVVKDVITNTNSSAKQKTK